MAKKQAAKPAVGVRVTTETREEPIVPDDEFDLEPDPAGDEDSDALSELRELGGGDGARYEVRRTSPAEFVGHIGTYSRDEFSLDRLAEEWGGGKFTVRVRGMGGQIIGSKPIQLAGLPKHRAAVAPVVSQAAPAPAVDLAGIVSAINAANQGQITMLTELVKGLINRPEPKVEKGPDVLEVMTALAPILRPEKSEAGGMAEGFKLFREGIEMGRELAGGGGGDDFTSLALKGMDMVKTVAANNPTPQRRPAQPARPAPQRIAGPAPGTVPAQEVAAPVEVVNPESPPMLKLLGWIKQQAQLLVYQAKRGKSPELYAELFLDNIPEGVTLETIYEQMAADNAIEKLAEVTGNQEILAHRPWFEEFRQEVLDQLVDDGEEEQRAADAADRLADAQPGEGGGDGGGDGS